MSDAQLLAQLASERSHVLRTVDGLENQEMRRTLVPSGWTMTQLLNHLAFDDEMFWISAVLGGDDRAIAELHNGWASEPMTGAEAINIYKREIARSDEGPCGDRFGCASPMVASSQRVRRTTDVHWA